MKIRLLVLLLFPLFSFGRKFYFSSSTGNDSYTTTQAQNPNTPWRTLVKLQNFAATSSPFPNRAAAGDTFLFKRGDVFANGADDYGSVKWWGGGYGAGAGFNCPSGTAENPIVFTNYGNVADDLPNILFPFPATTLNKFRHVLCFANVKHFVIDGLQFNDTRFPVIDKRTSSYCADGLQLGQVGSDAEGVPGQISNFVVRNCRFSNIAYGIESYGDTIQILDNVFTNFKSAGDTIGINDIGADALLPSGKKYLIKGNYISGSWAYANPNSSSGGLLGGGLESINDFDSSLIIYNIFIDNSGGMEFGQNRGTQFGPNDDTFAYNLFINNGKVIYVNTVGSVFSCSAARIRFWNNVIVDNEKNRFTGAGFGGDAMGDGQSFASSGFIFWPQFPVNPSVDNYSGYRTFQYGSDNIVGNPDTLLDIRNNIIWNTCGTQIKYNNRTKIFYRNNVYRAVGGFAFPTALGSTLGPGEVLANSVKIILDSSNAFPQNWDYRLAAASPAINAGNYVGAFLDYAGVQVSNPPDVGIYELGAPAPIAPSVTTASPTNINTTSVTSGGNVTSDGGSPVTRRGLMYSTSPVVDTTTGTKIIDAGSGVGTYTTIITGLASGTTYYVRAFAVNNVGVSYGANLAFTTLTPPTAPSVTTLAASSVTSTSALLGGSVTNQNNANVTRRGFVYSTSPITDTTNITGGGKFIDVGTGVGTYTTTISTLSASTLYYVRAFAVNSAGVGYGLQVTFTTLGVPVLATTPAFSIGLTTASSGGNITNTGGANITRRGLVYSTSPITDTNSITGGGRIIDPGTGAGSYTSSLTGLTSGTTYYIRAFAVNSAGVGLGSQLTFITQSPAIVPTVAITGTTVNVNFTTVVSTVQSEGSSPVTRRGVFFSTSPMAADTLSGTRAIDPSGGAGSYSINLSSLTPGTTYYVRAFAVNSAGVAISTEVTFTTWNFATLSTISPYSITTTGAFSGGNITNNGGVIILRRGLVYSTSPITDTNSIAGGGRAIFTGPAGNNYVIQLTGLNSGTLYYVRAFVVNLVGVSLGNQFTFTTSTALPPSVSTTSATSVSFTSATIGGNVTSQGTASVTRRGLVYSLSAVIDTNSTAGGGKIIDAGTGAGSFTSSLTGLLSNTTYHFRAFAINSVGITYGGDSIFTTLIPIVVPALSTTPATSITTTSAQSGGNISDSGNASVTRRGLIYSTSAIADTNDVTGGGKIINGSTGVGSYVSALTGLTPSTKYYIRAFAVNSAGAGYGNLDSFTTATPPSLPTIATLPAAFITTTTANTGGNITFGGNASVTRRGIIYSTGPITDTTSTTGGGKIISGSGTGIYLVGLSSLTPSTTYHIRAFAVNSVGVSYGVDLTFTTLAAVPRFSSFRARKKYVQKP
jgi:hypothetical protein